MAKFIIKKSLGKLYNWGGLFVKYVCLCNLSFLLTAYSFITAYTLLTVTRSHGIADHFLHQVRRMAHQIHT